MAGLPAFGPAAKREVGVYPTRDRLSGDSLSFEGVGQRGMEGVSRVNSYLSGAYSISQ